MAFTELKWMLKGKTKRVRQSPEVFVTFDEITMKDEGAIHFDREKFSLKVVVVGGCRGVVVDGRPWLGGVSDSCRCHMGRVSRCSDGHLLEGAGSGDDPVCFEIARSDQPA